MKVWGRKGDSKLVIDYDKKEKEKEEAKRQHEELQLRFQSIKITFRQKEAQMQNARKWQNHYFAQNKELCCVLLIIAKV